MSWFTIEFQCPLCKEKTKTAKFRKPTVFEPTIYNFKCHNCESRSALKITKPKGAKEARAIQIFVIQVFRSEKWKKMLEETRTKAYRVGW